VGDNQPYSGRDLNYTMNRHAEAQGIPYLGIEVRNDGLRNREGVARWTHILADCIAGVRRGLS
jgi:predicted N-formylglutamate amidohydrolase